MSKRKLDEKHYEHCMKRTKFIILCRGPGNRTNDKVSKLKTLPLAIEPSPCAFEGT